MEAPARGTEAPARGTEAGALARRGRLRTWRWRSPRALFGAACVGTAICLCAGEFLGRAPRARRAPPQVVMPFAGAPAFRCVVLTLDAAARVDPRCTRFVGTRFREEEFALASAEAQRKLRRPELQERASELTNNASVSIFANHMRVWRLVSASADDTPVLVLEDDAVLPPRLGRTLGALLERLRADNASNYVVKLHNSQRLWTHYEWAKAYRVERHDVRRCTCRPSHNSASNAAYLLDRRAAGVLLRSALPLSVHADVYVHEMGCVRHQVRLYSFQPNLVETSSRPSTHMSTFTLQRLYLLAVEALENMLAGECTRLRV
jgi:hypothetical protein